MKKTVTVILNWNGYDDTAECLRSLRQVNSGDHEVIVVDNGSIDGSPDLLQPEFPEVTLLRNEKNRGFADGSNVGIRCAMSRGASRVLLLNNDTVVAPNFLGLLIEEMEKDATIAAAGPAILHYEAPDLVWCAGATVDEATGESVSLFSGATTSSLAMETYECDYVSGCAILMSSRAIESVGYLDPRFFIYYEETDWCTRARRAGLRTVCVPEARVWHKIAVTSGRESPRVRYLMTRNRLLYVWKNARAQMRPARLTFALTGALRCAVTLAVRRRMPETRATLWGVLDFARGRFGPPRIA